MKYIRLILLSVALLFNITFSPGITTFARSTLPLRESLSYEAQPGQWPWMTRLLARGNDAMGGGDPGANTNSLDGYTFCGATLIEKEWVLTAKHCVDNTYQFSGGGVWWGLQLTVGDYSMDTIDPHERTFTVSASSIYSMSNLDIALIHLPKPVDDIPPVVIYPPDRDPAAAGAPTVVLGWGCKMTPSGLTNLPYGGQCAYSVNSNSKSAYNYESHILRMATPLIENVSATHLSLYEDVTGYGDSGGPLLVKNSEGQWVQVGIDETSRDFYKVSAGYDWIVQTMLDASGAHLPYIQNNLVVRGSAWFDEAQSGTPDGLFNLSSGDQPAEGVLVTLMSEDGTSLRETSTTSAGLYTFTNLYGGMYKIRFTAPAGYMFTQRDAAANQLDSLDSDVDPATGITGPIM
ncbi:MAG: trypsin-like serine protease, partial [Anaerolineae bacterium]